MQEIRARTDPVIRRAVSAGKRTAVIPVGSTEQHGPHLPVSTDSDIVGEVARRLAGRNGYHLCPVLTYGVSFEHAPLFNLSIKKSTLRRILDDLCASLLSNGMEAVFVINGHHGNQDAINDMAGRMDGATGGRLRVHAFSYWHFMERDFDHAGFVETSLMLAVSDKVRMGLAKRGLVTDGMTDREVQRIGQLAQKSFQKATGNGIWGDPRGATRADGQRILAEIVRNLGKKCQDCLTGCNP